MKVLSLFSGIGAFEKALNNLGIEYELVNYCEIDKYASKSYAAIHNIDESMNLGDITKVNEKELPKDIDLCTYGFPCQDISISGKMRGLFNEDGTQTRSGLFFEALRIIEETKPKVAIAENVKNLTSKKFSEQFKIVLDSLEKAGYNNRWAILNSKNFGIPQNRERVFIVSIRKDIDNGNFEFPQGFPLKLRLKDMLEDEVDEKYYMSEKAISYICATGTKNFHYEPEIDLEVARPLTSTMHKSHRASQDNYVSNLFLKNDVKAEIVNGKPIVPQTEKVINIGNVNPSGKGQNGTVVDSEGLARTITQEKGEGQKILVREATKRGYVEAVEGDSINFEQPNSKTRRGRVGHGVAQTLTTSPQQGAVTEDLRIRKLTPKECFRLMGFDDTDFEKAEKACSNTQLFKQAGNSICVPVIEHLITALFECGAFEKEDENQISFNDEESFNEIIKECQKGSDNETKEWISFNVRLSTKDTFALCEFLNSKGIEYKAV